MSENQSLACGNWWNTVRYTLFSPCYDRIIKPFAKPRQRALELLSIKENEQVLLLGAGSGPDLDYLPTFANYVAIDITKSMVTRCAEKAKSLGLTVECFVMDGQDLNFSDNYFDAIVLNLIIAVIPNPQRCLEEVKRVLKPDGRVVIFDKFLPNNAEANCCRKFLNLFTSCIFSDINRRLGDILSEADFEIMKEESVEGFHNAYKIVVVKSLKKEENSLKKEENSLILLS